MGVILGITIILISQFIPPLIPIGIYWVCLLAAIPSSLLMFYQKLSAIEYSLGVLFGLVIYIVFSFSGWEAMAGIIAFAQIIPLVTTIVVIIVFSILGGLWQKTHNKPIKRD